MILLVAVSAPFCGVFPCSLRNHLGHVYVFEFHVGFGAVHLTDVNRWGTPAKLINNLEISGAAKLSVGLSTGAVLNFDDVEDRDAAYDCMVNMVTMFLSVVHQSPWFIGWPEWVCLTYSQTCKM